MSGLGSPQFSFEVFLMIIEQLQLLQLSCSCSAKQEGENDSIKNFHTFVVHLSLAIPMLSQPLAATEARKCRIFFLLGTFDGPNKTGIS